MEQKPKYPRGFKLFNDKDQTEESALNRYFDKKACTVSVVTTTNLHDYTAQVCLASDYKNDTFHEIIIRRKSHTRFGIGPEWTEDYLVMDEYEAAALLKVLSESINPLGGMVSELWSDT